MSPDDARTFYIYCHTSPSGKRYIGQTCQRLNDRWNNGRGYKDQGYFSNAINKYGWDNFNHRILCVVHSKKLADLFEQHYINKYDTFNREHGYNLTKGGGGTLGRKATEEERRKISERNKGISPSEEVRRKISKTLRDGYRSGRIPAVTISEEGRRRLSVERTGSGNPMYGKHHTAEAAAKISAFHTGRKKSADTRRKVSESRYRSPKIKRCPVWQYDMDGNLVGHFSSLREAEEKTGYASSNIGNCARGKRKQAYGYVWRYQEQDTPSVTCDAPRL